MENNRSDFARMNITIHAPMAALWRAWTDPALILQWFGSDPKGKGLDAELDVRRGGHYSIHFMDSDGTDHTC